MKYKILNKYSAKQSDEICSLSDCKNYLIEIFGAFTTFCKKYEINCFLMWGTLLGAMRDGHIIPWDDDIDLGITEDDYKKLVLNLEYLKDYGLSYYHFSTHKDTYSNEIRIYKKGFYQMLDGDKAQYITPVCIDIFIARKIGTDISKKHITKVNKRMRKAYSLLINKEVKWETKSLLKRIAKRVYHFVLLFISNFRLHKKIEKLASSLYINGDYNYFFPDTLYHVDIKQYDKSYFETLNVIPFENAKFNAPNNADKLLTKIYGDWKKPSDRSGGKIFSKKFLKRIN